MQKTSSSTHQEAQEAVQIGDYVYYHPAIGKGKFSKVYFGYHSSSNDNVAVKKISKKSIERSSLERIENEVELLKKIKHQNVVSFKDVIKGTSNIYIICEYANGGDLKTLMKSHGPFNEKETKFYINQIKDAMKCLRSHNIVHRDIKPRNLLVNFKKKRQSIHYNFQDIQIKLADFGFAKQLEEDFMSETLCGTPFYMAPEIICSNKVHKSSDLWSIGIILYEMHFGTYPFGEPQNMFELKREMEFSFPGIPGISKCQDIEWCEHFYDLLFSILNQDPDQRISWEHFFNHEWFTCKCKLWMTKRVLSEDEQILQKDYNRREGSSLQTEVTVPILISKQNLHNSISKDEVENKIVSMIELIENYCDGRSFSAPTTSVPIQLLFPSTYIKEEDHTVSQPINIPRSHITRSSTYRKADTTKSVLSYIGMSFDNIKKFASK